MGYKGDCIMDCGYFWAPYLELNDEKPNEPTSISDEINKFPRRESRLDKRLKMPEEAVRIAKLIGWVPKF